MRKLKAHIHNHTEYSIKDGVCNIDNLIKKSKELGFEALAITDHGVVIGQRKFYDACINEGIKPILGVELYFSANGEPKDKCHMLALVINETGYKSLCEMISDANKNPYIVKFKGKPKAYPVVTPELLCAYFGPNANGHGTVIFTTACVGGFLSHFFNQNEKKKKEIAKLKSQITHLGDADIEKSIRLYDSVSEEYESLKKEIKKIEKLYYLDINVLSKVINTQKATTNAYRQNVEKYNEAVKVQREGSEKSINEKKAALEILKNKKAAMKTVAEKYKKDNAHNIEKLNKIAALEKELFGHDELKYKMAWILLCIGDIVGKDNLYVELQYHNLDIEREEKLLELEIAKEFEFKICLSNDVHYINKEDSLIRKVTLSLENKELMAESEDENEYYLKSEQELVEKLSEVFSIEDINAAIDGTNEICDRINLSFTKTTNRPVFITPDGYTSEEYMVYKIKEGIKKKFPNGFPEVEEGKESYIERLDREYQTIKKMGFVDYILIVMDYVQEAKRNQYNNESKVCYNVPPGRGSGAGSIINFLLDITNVDPVENDLIFERFLNPERVTMPDIDVDFAINIRKDIIEYVKKKHGEDSVCLISTVMRQYGKASIRNAARFLIFEEGTDSKETYNRYANIISKSFPRGCRAFSDKVITGTDENGAEETETTIEYLLSEFSNDRTALKILSLAEKLEGLATGYSTHAAGVIIDYGSVKKHVPLMYNVSNGKIAAQCDMVEAEGCFNLLKMDFLGLKTVDILSKAKELIYERHHKIIDLDHLPPEKEVYDNVISSGKTAGVFQLEGNGMRKFMMQLKPTSLSELTAGISLYRPGPMEYIPQYLKGKANPSEVIYACDKLEPILKETYGVITYQEQVIRIFNELAGYSAGRSDIVRRAISKKKSDVMEKERYNFIYGIPEEGVPGCIGNGISESVSSYIYDTMIDFARYAFNKSHGLCYATISYQTAWLKYHYPLEFYTALLSYSGKNKYQRILSEAKEEGIVFRCPSIHGSETDFHINDEDEIVFSINAIDGINDAAERLKNLKLHNTSDFDEVLTALLDTDSSVKFDERNLEYMVKAGVFDCINKNRKALADVLPSKIELTRKLVKKQQKCEELFSTYNNVEASFRNLKKLSDEIESLKVMRKNIVANTGEYTYLEMLNNEKAVLNVFLSGHPLDLYPVKVNGYENIEDLEAGKGMVRIFGYVGEIKEKKRKKDDKLYAAFQIEGKRDSIHANIYSKEYEQYKDMMINNAVMAFEGYVTEQESIELNENGEEEITISLSFIVKRVMTAPEPEQKDIMIHINNFDEWSNIIYNETIQYMKESDGITFYVHDRETGLIRKGSFKVSKDIIKNKVIECVELCDGSYG